MTIPVTLHDIGYIPFSDYGTLFYCNQQEYDQELLTGIIAKNHLKIFW